VLSAADARTTSARGVRTTYLSGLIAAELTVGVWRRHL
jgi:hypothetical protein